jgi:hypothetical protein
MHLGVSSSDPRGATSHRHVSVVAQASGFRYLLACLARIAASMHFRARLALLSEAKFVVAYALESLDAIALSKRCCTHRAIPTFSARQHKSPVENQHGTALSGPGEHCLPREACLKFFYYLLKYLKIGWF